MPGIDIDEKRIVSSTGALEFAAVPKQLLVVGAGIIGLELGSVWRRLGAEVTIVEFFDHILPGIDGEVGRQFHRMLQKQGFAFRLASKVAAIDASGKTLKVKVEPVAGGPRRRSTPTSFWSRSGGCPIPTASASKRSA